jgi:hypothetical protein
MGEVTDTDLLAKLNASDSNEVTDPDLLAKLNKPGSFQDASPTGYTDPFLQNTGTPATGPGAHPHPYRTLLEAGAATLVPALLGELGPTAVMSSAAPSAEGAADVLGPVNSLTYKNAPNVVSQVAQQAPSPVGAALKSAAIPAAKKVGDWALGGTVFHLINALMDGGK